MSESDLRKVVALLVPVPLVHLESGLKVCDTEGRVAFGTRAWEVLRYLDTQKKMQSEIEVYIYASLAAPSIPAKISWGARFVRYVDSRNGAHPDGMRYRPPSTAGEDVPSQRAWAGFWEVSELTRFLEGLVFPVFELTGLGKEKAYKKNFVPEGPTLVHLH